MISNLHSLVYQLFHEQRDNKGLGLNCCDRAQTLKRYLLKNLTQL